MNQPTDVQNQNNHQLETNICSQIDISDTNHHHPSADNSLERLDHQNNDHADDKIALNDNKNINNEGNLNNNNNSKFNGLQKMFSKKQLERFDKLNQSHLRLSHYVPSRPFIKSNMVKFNKNYKDLNKTFL